MPTRELRAAGWSLVAAGVLFLVVVTYLFTVLLASGLTFDLFDDARGLLVWGNAHLTRYLVMYLLYLAQQVALLAAPLLLLRALPRGGPLVRYGAASAGLLSVGLGVVSVVLLIMVTRTSGAQYAQQADETLRLSVLLTNDVAADMAKGVRVVSEVLLGLWLAWLGAALAGAGRDANRPAGRDAGRAAARGAGRGWWLVTAAGVWTAAVGLGKLIDPALEFEDWVGFVTGPALLAAGVGVLRLAGRAGAAAAGSAAAGGAAAGGAAAGGAADDPEAGGRVPADR